MIVVEGGTERTDKTETKYFGGNRGAAEPREVSSKPLRLIRKAECLYNRRRLETLSNCPAHTISIISSWLLSIEDLLNVLDMWPKRCVIAFRRRGSRNMAGSSRLLRHDRLLLSSARFGASGKICRNWVTSWTVRTSCMANETTAVAPEAPERPSEMRRKGNFEP